MVENMLELSLFKYSRKESTRSNVVGMRATYGLTTLTLKDLYPDLTIFSADTSTSAGLDRFKTSHSDSFFDCGISEQCMVAAAAGFVAGGGIALASTFAPFLILRAAEQVRLSLGYMNLPIVITGLASGLSLGYLGYTHCCVEDLPFALSIPNIYVYSPSDAYELKLFLPEIVKQRKPTYIRLTGASKVEPVHKTDITTDFSSPIKISNLGSKLLVLSTGSISSNVVQAINLLPENYSSLLSHYVVPFFDHKNTTDQIAKLASEYDSVFVVDESMYGGLASFTSMALAKNSIFKPLHASTHPHKYLSCGSHDYMLQQCKLDVKSLQETILSILAS